MVSLAWECLSVPRSIEYLKFTLKNGEDVSKTAKLRQSVHEMDSYIRLNHAFIPNYGERYRYGERISTAFTESAVNQVLSKRMSKKQQMRGTRQGAHHLLQIRTRVLNRDLRRAFVQWYPGMQTGDGKTADVA